MANSNMFLSLILLSLSYSSISVAVDQAGSEDKIQGGPARSNWGVSFCQKGCLRDCESSFSDFVCGSDGVSYGSYCAFLNEKCSNKSLFVAYEGKCESEGTCSRFCPLPILPIFHCGSDNVSYSSLCSLEEQSCSSQTQLLLLHRGECEKCAGGCPEVYSPVCGSDGKTHENLCVLNRESCVQGKAIRAVHQGSCRVPAAIISEEICAANVSSKVCGSDGLTYFNSCFLREAVCHSQRLFQVHKGECDNSSCSQSCPRLLLPEWVCGSDEVDYWSDCDREEASCREKRPILKLYDGKCFECFDGCPEIYDPVCGSDGMTYENRCLLNQASCKSHRKCGPLERCSAPKPIYLAYAGDCKKVVECQKACPLIYDPVCGSNGQTFSNECLLNIAHCKDATITKKHAGKCNSCPSVCPFIHDPVCGSDGQTYVNSCSLGIQSCLSGGRVSKKYDGECKDCPGACPSIFSPVCGTNNKTYSNACFLAQAICSSSQPLNKKHDGPCQNRQSNNCDKPCTKEFVPVCASNGKDYNNKCLFEVEDCRMLGALEIEYEGKCRKE